MSKSEFFSTYLKSYIVDEHDIEPKGGGYQFMHKLISHNEGRFRKELSVFRHFLN